MSSKKQATLVEDTKVSLTTPVEASDQQSSTDVVEDGQGKDTPTEGGTLTDAKKKKRASIKEDNEIVLVNSDAEVDDKKVETKDDGNDDGNSSGNDDSEEKTNETDRKDEASRKEEKTNADPQEKVSDTEECDPENMDKSEESSEDEKVRDAYASLALGDRNTQDKRRTKVMRRLNKEMDYLIERTTRVIEIVSKDTTPPKALKKKRKKLAPKSSEPKSTEPVKGTEPSTITSTDSAVTILRDHLKQSHLEPVYKHVNIKGSGHMVEHTFTCTLLDITTEGKSRRKMEAKEEAALILLKQLVRAQKTKSLNDQIPPFTDNDLKCMASLLNEKDNFENHLQNMCYQIHEPPPLYSVAVQGTENKYFSVQCDAMGYTVIGNSKKEKIARKIAAKSVLDLVAIDQEKEKEREKQREKQVKAPLELTLPRREYHNFRI